MKNRILSLIIFFTLCLYTSAQDVISTLNEIKNNPDYIVCTVKNASIDKARAMCLNKLAYQLTEVSQDIFTAEQIKPYVKEISLNFGDITELYMYVKKADIGTAPAPVNTPAQSTQAVATTAQTQSNQPTPAKKPMSVPGTVSFKFTDDWAYGDALRQKLETNISKLLTEINIACSKKQEINLEGIDMTDDAKKGLIEGFKHYPYACKEKNNVQRCLASTTDCSVRDIPVYSLNHPEHDKNISISFDKSGVIELVRFAAETASYDKIMKNGGVEITDANDLARRTSILSFVENYRNYYITKDIDKIEQIFADDAIIITGSVVKNIKHNTEVSFGKGVVYKKQNKEEYLKSLKGVFSKNETILVLYDDIQVIQDRKRPHIYGVTLKQSWDSRRYGAKESYHDDGYVFLLWDFQDPENPKIHVRTWQPLEVVTENGQVKQEQILGLGSFRY